LQESILTEQQICKANTVPNIKFSRPPLSEEINI